MKFLSVLLFAALLISFYTCNSALAIEEDNIQYHSEGQIDSNDYSYLYAGKVIFDEAEGLFKYWGCGGVYGDYIILKESTTYEGLNYAPWQPVFTPTGTGTFDNSHVCDPSVVEHNGVFYLHYSGIDDTIPEADQATRAGVAISYDRGRTFTRLFNGKPIITPTHTGLYGAGQSSVVRGPDGYFYMLYSDLNEKQRTSWIRFLRSPVPSFPPSLQTLVKSYPAYKFGAVSLELAYNRGRGRFEVIANHTDVAKPHLARVRVVHLDLDLNILGETEYSENLEFMFGEGIATVTNSFGEIIPFGDPGKMHWNFVATTHGKNRGFGSHIAGPVKFIRFTEGVNGVLTDFSKIGENSFSGDLDGDTKEDIIVLDKNNFVWKWKLSSEKYSKVHTKQWGLPGKDIPIIVKDWNRDGKDEIAVFREAEGKWYIFYNGSNHQVVSWGTPGDHPMSADTNGDGKTELIVWRPSNGVWYVLYSGSWPNVNSRSTQYGIRGDDIFMDDTNNDGKDDFVVWRRSNSRAYIKKAK